MIEKAGVIAAICDLVTDGKIGDALAMIDRDYPFDPKMNQQMRVGKFMAAPRRERVNRPRVTHEQSRVVEYLRIA